MQDRLDLLARSLSSYGPAPGTSSCAATVRPEKAFRNLVASGICASMPRSAYISAAGQRAAESGLAHESAPYETIEEAQEAISTLVRITRSSTMSLQSSRPTRSVVLYLDWVILAVANAPFLGRQADRRTLLVGFDWLSRGLYEYKVLAAHCRPQMRTRSFDTSHVLRTDEIV